MRINKRTQKYQPCHQYLQAGLGKLALGSALIYGLCAAGPGFIEYITSIIPTIGLLTVVVAVGIALADVGGILLVLSSISDLRKAFSINAVLKATRHTDQGTSNEL